jgi:DNA-binding NarL/FixJ family response regulator
MRKLRTVMVEDETMFRQLVHSTLRRARDLHVTAAFELGRPALEYCLRREIDLLVVALVLPDLNGMEIVREIRRSRPEVLILIITAHPSAQLPAELIALGVNGYVDKTEPIGFVLKAIETVRHGGMFFASHVQAKTAKFAPGTARVLPVPLTRREEEITRMVASERMSKEIAERLKVRPFFHEHLLLPARCRPAAPACPPAGSRTLRQRASRDAGSGSARDSRD